jgi:hypothetical protein
MEHKREDEAYIILHQGARSRGYKHRERERERERESLALLVFPRPVRFVSVSPLLFP